MNVHAFIRQRNRLERRFPTGAKRNNALRHLVREAGATIIIHDGRLSGWRLPCGSVVCSKRRFPNPEQAQQHLQRLQSDPCVKQVPIRYYHCAGCNGLHLTRDLMR